jgi:hypothetical protein
MLVNVYRIIKNVIVCCKVKLFLINHYAMRWGRGGIAPPFLILTLDGGEFSAICPFHFTPGTHWIGGWVGPRAGLDSGEEKYIAPARIQTPAHSPLLD